MERQCPGFFTANQLACQCHSGATVDATGDRIAQLNRSWSFRLMARSHEYDLRAAKSVELSSYKLGSAAETLSPSRRINSIR